MLEQWEEVFEGQDGAAGSFHSFRGNVFGQRGLADGTVMTTAPVDASGRRIQDQVQPTALTAVVLPVQDFHSVGFRSITRKKIPIPCRIREKQKIRSTFFLMEERTKDPALGDIVSDSIPWNPIPFHHGN